MLITELKSKETLAALTEGKRFLSSTAWDVRKYISRKRGGSAAEGVGAGRITGILTTDYICNPENLKLRLPAIGGDTGGGRGAGVFLRRGGADPRQSWRKSRYTPAAIPTRCRASRG